MKQLKFPAPRIKGKEKTMTRREKKKILRELRIGVYVPPIYTNDNGNRTWEYPCGCVETSGAGSYGTIGSAYAIDWCSFEHEETGFAGGVRPPAPKRF